MTKYLETKRNSIEEAISSVVLGENGFVVGKVKMPKMKGGAKLQSKTNFDFSIESLWQNSFSKAYGDKCTFRGR